MLLLARLGREILTWTWHMYVSGTIKRMAHFVLPKICLLNEKVCVYVLVGCVFIMLTQTRVIRKERTLIEKMLP